MFRQVTVFLVLLAAASQSAIGADEARRWPNEFGEIIRADLVMIRSKDVVLRQEPYPGKLVVVSFDKLRPVDQRYVHLDRLRERSDYTKAYDELPQPLRDMAAIHDAATLIRAASHFRGKSKAEIVKDFERYLETWVGGGCELWLLTDN